MKARLAARVDAKTVSVHFPTACEFEGLHWDMVI